MLILSANCLDSGLLVRHATYIAEELASTGVVEVLSEALKVRAGHGAASRLDLHRTSCCVVSTQCFTCRHLQTVTACATFVFQDKNERVRRRVIATLGELLFYIATQQQDNAAAAAVNGGAAPADPAVVWGITGNTYAQVG